MTVATAAAIACTNQPVLLNGVVITAFTTPVSRPATTRAPKACHQWPPTSSQERPMAWHPVALDHQRLDTDGQPHPDVDARDDEQDQPGDGGQPDQDAHGQDRSQPVEPEAVALLHAGVLAGHLGRHRPGDRPRETRYIRMPARAATSPAAPTAQVAVETSSRLVTSPRVRIQSPAGIGAG